MVETNSTVLETPLTCTARDWVLIKALHATESELERLRQSGFDESDAALRQVAGNALAAWAADLAAYDADATFCADARQFVAPLENVYIEWRENLRRVETWRGNEILRRYDRKPKRERLAGFVMRRVHEWSEGRFDRKVRVILVGMLCDSLLGRVTKDDSALSHAAHLDRHRNF